MFYDFLRFPGFREKAFTLSYDDGTIHDLRLANILNAHGIKATFNLNSGSLGQQGKISREEAIICLLQKGHEIAVHGVEHLNLPAVPSSAALRDIMEDRLSLEALSGGIVRGMAYAFGSYDDAVVAMLKACGIAYARTVITTENFGIPTDWLRMPTTCHHANPHLSALTERFLAPATGPQYWYHTPKLFYVWGHSYEFADNDNWDIIEGLAEKVGGRDDVWYATNMEIYEYVKAYDSLIFSAKCDSVKNPSAIDVYFSLPKTGNVLVPAGKTVLLS